MIKPFGACGLFLMMLPALSVATPGRIEFSGRVVVGTVAADVALNQGPPRTQAVQPLTQALITLPRQPAQLLRAWAAPLPSSAVRLLTLTYR